MRGATTLKFTSFNVTDSTVTWKSIGWLTFESVTLSDIKILGICWKTTGNFIFTILLIGKELP